MKPLESHNQHKSCGLKREAYRLRCLGDVREIQYARLLFRTNHHTDVQQSVTTGQPEECKGCGMLETDLGIVVDARNGKFEQLPFHDFILQPDTQQQW